MKTKLIRGTFDDSIGIEVTKKDNFGESELHGHDFYELDIIVGGENVTRLNREEINVKRGDVFFMTPEDFHDYSDGGSLDILNLHFAEDFISKELLFSLVSCGKRYFSLSDDHFCRFEKLGYILHELYSEGVDRRVISRLVESLLLLLLRESKDSEAVSQSENIQKAIVYINAHFKENPTLSEVASIIPFNERYFCKRFKEYTGESYKEYLKKLKLSYARRLLLVTDYSIIEIAERSGYQTQSHFNREYKEYYGVTPRETRACHI